MHPWMRQLCRMADSAAGVANWPWCHPVQQYNDSAEGGKLPEHIDAAWCSGIFSPRLGSARHRGRTVYHLTTTGGAEAACHPFRQLLEAEI